MQFVPADLLHAPRCMRYTAQTHAHSGARQPRLPPRPGAVSSRPLKLKLSVLTLSQRLVTPRTPRISGARLGVQPLQLPEIPIHYKWGPQ